ncbi:uncharacterized protein LOC120081921 [Benincasa hispida]|uniref:uncharacterized protein LOC120081921 n=1 Tax=Benincasa hispida TaxID=102211 RepID=UPI001900B8C3|nr:uncharacterized protein LOC120081921 [Benincasa hispida]
MQSKILEKEDEGGRSKKKEGESGIIMEVKVLEVDKMEFWPLQHPLEPDDEDHPVICPMPNSTSLLDEGTMHNGKRTPESWRKRTEVSREIKATAETRPVRKRHHRTLSRPDHLMAEWRHDRPPRISPSTKCSNSWINLSLDNHNTN